MYGMECIGCKTIAQAVVLLAEFSLHESFTEHIQVPKSKLEVNQISKLKIRNKEFLAVIRLASPSNKEEGGVQFLFPLFAVQVFEKRHQLSALLQSCPDETRNNAMDHSARTLVANPTPQSASLSPLQFGDTSVGVVRSRSHRKVENESHPPQPPCHRACKFYSPALPHAISPFPLEDYSSHSSSLQCQSAAPEGAPSTLRGASPSLGSGTAEVYFSFAYLLSTRAPRLHVDRF